MRNELKNKFVFSTAHIESILCFNYSSKKSNQHILFTTAFLSNSKQKMASKQKFIQICVFLSTITTKFQINCRRNN